MLAGATSLPTNDATRVISIGIASGQLADDLLRRISDDCCHSRTFGNDGSDRDGETLEAEQGNHTVRIFFRADAEDCLADELQHQPGAVESDSKSGN